MTSAKRIIVALDFASEAQAVSLVERLDPTRCRLKVGKELFTRCGPAFVEALQLRGFDVFLDLKFHDIPNTVAGACAAAADLGVWMVNLHISGGAGMIQAARTRLDAMSSRPLLIGVTLLTSLSREDLIAVGCPGEPGERVVQLAALGHAAGLDGVVCSPLEAAAVRAAQGPDFRLVTPGVRPAGTSLGDQVRVMTPRDALAAGADDLVIGRPITAAKDPLAALQAIEDSLVD
ncbi:orotidine-5'-phosphate decarboxylase [Thiocapsa bogorovii]|uniref:orotidine-5'-phosphate decarboxylase n=1 Tax=Thiocapsa bogorovii TaxID=521689 RepID=UPI001E4EA033|nr:orotidine-5'-phosphate decarboxylase [Thiocapsa bogorovii]UHD18062.1 orotidine-5'-phosphate decarboxylase [Thiocapsa bogorovii]